MSSKWYVSFIYRWVINTATNQFAEYRARIAGSVNRVICVISRINVFDKTLQFAFNHIQMRSIFAPREKFK